MASTVSNKIKYLLATKAIDFSADSFKIILMASGFVFNADTHHGYAADGWTVAAFAARQSPC